MRRVIDGNGCPSVLDLPLVPPRWCIPVKLSRPMILLHGDGGYSRSYCFGLPFSPTFLGLVSLTLWLWIIWRGHNFVAFLILHIDEGSTDWHWVPFLFHGCGLRNKPTELRWLCCHVLPFLRCQSCLK